jgi:hypothetical protein
MRLQALIVVGIGVILASFVLFQRRSVPELKRLANACENPPKAWHEGLENERNQYRVFYAGLSLVHFVTFGSLVVWFFKIGRRKYPSESFANRPPKNEEELIWRLYCEEEAPPRRKILVLLAMIAAIAFVGSACICPLG